MTKLERIIRQVSDLRDFYLKMRTVKKRTLDKAPVRRGKHLRPVAGRLDETPRQIPKDEG